MGHNKRSVLKSLGMALAGTASFATISTAKSSSQDISKLAVSSVENNERSIIAFTSLDDYTLCLNVAIGADSLSDSADDIQKVTTATKGSVFDIHWEDNSTLSYWQDGKVWEVTIANGNVSSPSAIQNKSRPDAMSTLSDTENGTISSQAVSGGGYLEPPGPDWMDSSKYDQDPIKMCNDASFGEICIKTSSISPKFFSACSGSSIPLVGFSYNPAQITVNGTTFSFGLDYWAGYNPKTLCFHFGAPDVNLCGVNCYESLPTRHEIRSDFKSTIEEAAPSSSELNRALDIAIDIAEIAVGVIIAILVALALAVFGAATGISA